jgi:hypothetical protein
VRLLTSLGEEGTKALIRLSRLTLLSQVSIRLSKQNALVQYFGTGAMSAALWTRRYVPGYRAQGSRAIVKTPQVSHASHQQWSNEATWPHCIMLKLTSQQEFAIWQPAWPTMGSRCVSTKGCDMVEDAGHERCAARRGFLTVDADDFSHFDFACSSAELSVEL